MLAAPIVFLEGGEKTAVVAEYYSDLFAIFCKKCRLTPIIKLFCFDVYDAVPWQ